MNATTGAGAAKTSTPEAEAETDEQTTRPTEGQPEATDGDPALDMTLDALATGEEEDGAPEAAEEAEDGLQETVARLADERDQLRDRLMRALADGENSRRRAERDRKDAETYGGTKLARDLLTVHDSLARAVDAADEEMKAQHPAFFEGIALTQKALLDAFVKHKIVPVRPEPGERFDPNLHEAMFEAPVPGAEPGTVLEVMETGFKIADRLLRPARVGVARAG